MLNSNEDILIGVSVTDTSGVHPARLIRLPEVMSRVGLKRTAIYMRMKEGRFPQSRSLGSKCAVWVESEINAWVDAVATKDGRTQ